MLLMNLEMLDFHNTLNFQEFVCLVVNQLVSLPYLRVLSVLIAFQEEMVFAQEDLLSWDLITQPKVNHGPNSMRFQTKSSLVSTR
mgnify:CR=1 FL=1